MAIRIHDKTVPIGQSSTATQRQLIIRQNEQRTNVLDVIVERKNSATGMVAVYAKLLECESWSLLGNVDLSKLSEPWLTRKEACIVALMVQPVGVVGEFVLAYNGW